MSEGPPKDDDQKKQKPATKMEWGNVVVLEHRLADGKYATTIYGHLANERLVKVGDVVEAGQQIGTIGTTRVNGGYKPHLHLGVREGRMAAVGRKLLVMTTDGKPTRLEIAEIREDNIVLTGANDLPEQLQMGLDGRKFQINKRDDKAEVNAAFLSYVPSPDFMIVGYGLSTDGWMDPIAFLKAHGADVNPAPFGPAKRRRN
jgi:murein DD-endopeptidase MepM/ murein hydrolase activator NlpD